jgi:hypothetical protein
MESHTSDTQASFVVPAGTLTFLLLALLIFLAIYQMESPAALPADAPATEFSAARASEHLTAIAQSPRPVESAANLQARDYLVAELRSLGLEPQIQTAVMTYTLPNRPQGSATVQNVLARIEGSANTNNAVAIAAHYDSVERGPGASDDAAGVAAMLETARAILAGTPPSNDVVFVLWISIPGPKTSK